MSAHGHVDTRYAEAVRAVISGPHGTGMRLEFRRRKFEA